MERHGRSQHLATSQGSARPANLPNTHGASTQVAQHPQTYQQVHQQQQHDQVQRYLGNFWAKQYQEIEQTTDFKNHSLPLARIKKIMKADEDVKMISAEAPVIFARACEIFILELTLRSWNHTEENKRRTLQKNDIAAAVTTTDVFDFLVDIIPREDIKDEVFANMPRGNDMPATGLPDALPYYHMVPQHVLPVGAPGMTLGSTVMDQSVYGQQLCPYTGLHIWPHNQQLQQPPYES